MSSINKSSSSSSSSHWSFEFHPLLNRGFHHLKHHLLHTNHTSTNNFVLPNEELLLSVSIPLAQLFSHDLDAYRAFVPTTSSSTSTNVSHHENEISDDDDNDYNIIMRQASAARVALSDYTARCLADLLPVHSSNNNNNNSSKTTFSFSKDGMKSTNEDDISIIIQTMGQQSRHSERGGITLDGLKNMNNKKKKKTPKKETPLPFVLERTDCMVVQVPQSQRCDGAGTTSNNSSTTTTTTALKFLLRATFIQSSSSSSSSTSWKENTIRMLLSPTLHQLHSRLISSSCYQHVACVVLQRMLRSMLLPPRPTSWSSASSSSLPSWQSQQAQQQTHSTPTHQEHHQYLNAIAFIADGSLLPRKSGRSMLPMPSPPSLPFVSPHPQHQPHGENDASNSSSAESSQLTKIVTVNVGKFWRKFLNEDGSTTTATDIPPTSSTSISSKTVTMRGMIIPCGVTLIVGGGYHGKSTLLQQALVMGVYDKIPGDGRERCVSHEDSVSIRAEDGRYVNNVNISAFISELPKIKSWGTSTSSVSASSLLCDTTSHDRRSDVTRFGTKDASGSTSQAANVIEAIECGASALLVDEDVSAANFMARDGRMRAMIMNEPITPLLYRVNGLFLSKGISTVVVVGGVGDWLDVADAVVLMQDYVAYDGLKKARSVSYQFSYGHVQYAGRGVVHRLPWEVKDTPAQKDSSSTEEDATTTVSTLSPLRRRPYTQCVNNKFNNVAMLDSSSSRLWFYQTGCDDSSDTIMDSSGDDDNDGDDEDEGIVDMSKCSQLIDNAPEQMVGCGICVLWLIQEARRRPGEDLLDLLIRMERELHSGGSEGGMNKLLSSLEESRAFENNEALVATTTINLLRSSLVLDLWETVGCAYRPRRHEVAMALTRMRGMKFEILPEKPKVGSISPEEEAKLLEEESKKRTLAELWKNRRRK